MMEALTQRNQQNGKTTVSFFRGRARRRYYGDGKCIDSASSLQLLVIGDALGGLHSDAQRAIQFTRSTPGITHGLVGMKSIAHVEHNLELIKVPPASFVFSFKNCL